MYILIHGGESPEKEVGDSILPRRKGLGTGAPSILLREKD